MSKLTCPICSHINTINTDINQNYCSLCHFPLVPNRLNFSSLSSSIKAELFPQEAIKWAKNIYLQNLQLKINLENFNQGLEQIQPQLTNNDSLNEVNNMNENVQDLIKNITEMIVLLQNKLNTQPEQRSLIQSELNNLNQIIADLSQKPKLNNNENIPKLEDLTPNKSQITNDSLPAENTTITEELQPETSTDSQEVIATKLTTKPETLTAQVPVPKLSPWLSAYNDNPVFFADYAIDVIVTKESFNQRLRDINQPIILEKVGKFRGMFWILEANRLEQCLVPKGNLTVDADNLSLIQLLFECINYYPDNQKFILIKPALITPFKPNQWRVTELGIVQFS